MQVNELMATDVVTIGWNDDLRLVDDIMGVIHTCIDCHGL